MSYQEIRPARAEDRETILAFCAKTWQWGDYIEHVWDEWLHDSNGLLLVATVDGNPAGISHMVMVSESDVWFEGLRVDPQFRQQGLARALNEFAVVEAVKRGATHARLAVDASNTRSIHITEHPDSQMHKVATFTLFSALPLDQERGKKETQARTQLATLEDLDAIIAYVNASNIFPMTGGLYHVSFKSIPMTVEFLEDKIVHQQVYLLRRWERIDGLAIAEIRGDHRGKTLSLGYIDGTVIESISLIAYDLRQRLSAMGAERLRVYAPDLMLVRDALDGIGYDWEDSTFYIYERRLV